VEEDIWHNPRCTINEAAKTVTIDFHTSPEGEEPRGRYDGTAAVTYGLKTSAFHFDGLEHDPAAEAQAIHDFLTHFHSDCVNAKALEVIQKGLKSTVTYPMPALENSRKKRTFELIQSIAGTGNCQVDTQNSVCQIAPAAVGLPAPAVSGAMGPFLYSRYEFEGLTVETFKHLNRKDENTDGLICRLTHNGVSHLLFGDFDDEKALTELLELSKTNGETGKSGRQFTGNCAARKRRTGKRSCGNSWIRSPS
jgi:hypothetical protein